MRYFGYPKETQGTVPWKDKPMRIIDGKTWWFEDCGIWWCEETAEEFTDEEYVGRMKRLSKILNEPRIGFVKEHGSKRRPLLKVRPIFGSTPDNFFVAFKQSAIVRWR